MTSVEGPLALVKVGLGEMPFGGYFCTKSLRIGNRGIGCVRIRVRGACVAVRRGRCMRAGIMDVRTGCLPVDAPSGVFPGMCARGCPQHAQSICLPR